MKGLGFLKASNGGDFCSFLGLGFRFQDVVVWLSVRCFLKGSAVVLCGSLVKRLDDSSSRFYVSALEAGTAEPASRSSQ